MFKIANKQHVGHSVEVTEYNLHYWMEMIEKLTEYHMVFTDMYRSDEKETDKKKAEKKKEDKKKKEKEEIKEANKSIKEEEEDDEEEEKKEEEDADKEK